MREEAFPSRFPLAAVAVPVPAKLSGARYLTQGAAQMGNRLLQTIKGGAFTLSPAVFTFPLLFFPRLKGGGEIQFKLEIPGFAVLQQLKFLE